MQKIDLNYKCDYKCDMFVILVENFVFNISSSTLLEMKAIIKLFKTCSHKKMLLFSTLTFMIHLIYARIN